ncbi:MAG: glycogen debranching N-terminal domain-containing protein, partial [Acidimicrobiales bacterium]
MGEQRPPRAPLPLTEPAATGAADIVTLLEGACFCISSDRGDIEPGSTQGVFFLDSRLLSELRLVVNGAEPELLAVMRDDPFAATFVARQPPPSGVQDSTLLVVRRRYVGQG